MILILINKRTSDPIFFSSFFSSFSICYNISQLKTNIYIYIYIYIVGPKSLGTTAHFKSSPRPTLRRKKCLRMNNGNPDCQGILPRTTLSSADQNHRRGRCHVARGSPLEDPKGDSEPNRPAIGAW